MKIRYRCAFCLEPTNPRGGHLYLLNIRNFDGYDCQSPPEGLLIYKYIDPIVIQEETSNSSGRSCK